MFITFKISVDNYNTYSLNYYDVKQDSDFYEGEITNKKIKVDNYYINFINNYIVYIFFKN